ncbi:ImmA/IrrE family metallo-endopeptidase [Thioalkalivibrio sp. ALJ16]|uniref:ImmA/IrrE family metallo-endopeptidase n=1 Tax=Thioalkalivibrio sp. ALJ16 TaxID=1158762 RepID=UPI0003823982|nr:ImmA/IrrE family metallo-endopeptidase [Thioalkalivibrio sp. ALJ16]
MNRVSVNPELITWARERAGLEPLELTGRFPRLAEWESGEVHPTLRQLEGFARAVHVPVGYLFLPAPPVEALPIPDFRTLGDRDVARPSPNLLDTLYLCQQRQEWYRDHARLHGLEPVTFVGSAQAGSDVVEVAGRVRETLGLSVAERQRLPSWTEALRQLVSRAEEAGVLVMASSIVGSNSHRKLDVAEFRGFALVDDLAPLVFINAADSKAAQMFTLAHELAHLWLGESGVFDVEAGRLPNQRVERWCNRVAAEVLMPLERLHGVHQPGVAVPEEIQRLARRFKVSTLVALRRLFDGGLIDQVTLWECYRQELERIRALDRGGSGGGDFYRTMGARTGKRFARAVMSSTLEGQTLFQDAFRMLGVRKTSTFYEAARAMGVML